MTAELNHTIIRVRDKHSAATFLAEILGIPVQPQWGPFVPIQLGNGVTLDYLDVDDAKIQPQHYSFLVSDPEFDAAFARIKDAGLTYWADPFHQQPSQINHNDGGKGVYFDDPDGHILELQTTPYGTPAS